MDSNILNPGMARRIEVRATADLQPYAGNAKMHPPEQVQQIAASITRFGFNNPILVDESSGEIVAGHGRLLAAQLLGLAEVPVVVLDHLDDRSRRAYILADNKTAEGGEWDEAKLSEELLSLAADDGFEELALTGFNDSEIAELMGDNLVEVDGHWRVPPGAATGGATEAPAEPPEVGRLVDRFIVPPFSVLDTRQGYWATRRAAWRELIGDAGESRELALSLSDAAMLSNINSGVSILDPVLAELVCKWFALPGHKVFDPFAGDTVFGYVAAHSGLDFTGIELRQEQRDLNQQRLDDAGLAATYICDSSENTDAHIEDESQDLIFTCPPYADLERYSDDPRDLSNLPHDEFKSMYAGILTTACRKLKPNRFAVVTISEVRGKEGPGRYLGLVPHTIATAESAGLMYYNEMILVNTCGTLPMRAPRFMNQSRKVGRVHQNVLVFYKPGEEGIGEVFGDINVCEEQEEDGAQ